MSELVRTGSMTSVTQEDSSIDSESDTTESSYSNVTSSVLSSTDTDDKLTPSLGQISISTVPPKECHSLHTTKKGDQTLLENVKTHGTHHGHLRVLSDPRVPQSRYKAEPVTTLGPHSSVNPPPSRQPAASRKRSMRDRNLLQSVLCRPHAALNMNTNACFVENLGVDDLENKLSTDFSDTSSIAVAGEGDSAADHLASTSQDDIEAEDNCYNNISYNNNSGTGRSPGSARIHKYSEPVTLREEHAATAGPGWEPDMASGEWHQAGCFSRYWQHYGFVMAWYRAHMDAVRKLHRDFSCIRPPTRGWWRHPGQGLPNMPRKSGVVRSRKSKQTRRIRRARNRRNAKARNRAQANSVSGSATEAVDKCTLTGLEGTANDGAVEAEVEQEEEEEEMEMEITDEMLDFFKTSLKHRMERDEAKNGDATESNTTETRINIEDATAGQTAPSTAPPQERPGARRALEMKQLYGQGAAMIHGMETALQMTFDRTQDKYQAKLWPNMPLKIVFG